jgi:hypothetical protein
LATSAGNRDWRDERRAEDVIDDLFQLMPEQIKPTFAWVHLFDAHWPASIVCIQQQQRQIRIRKV